MIKTENVSQIVKACGPTCKAVLKDMQNKKFNEAEELVGDVTLPNGQKASVYINISITETGKGVKT
jgi:hypothetical protein